MQTKIVLASLFLATVGTHAAPSLEARQNDFVPINIYDGPACQNSVVITANIPKDGTCFAFSPILTQTTDSARIDLDGVLPPGCTLTLFNTADCNISGNFISETTAHHCSTFGTGNPIDNFIRAARLTGTCN